MKARLLVLTLVLAAAACSQGSTYTLYRNSVLNDGMWLHIATFDARDGEKYNRENCTIAAELFQSQPGVKVRYWCEKKGTYKQ